MLTSLFRVKNAIRFVNQEASNLWLVIAHPTPWSSSDATYGADGINPPSDSNVPPPPSNATTLTNPICAIKASVLWVVENDSTGTYSFEDANGNQRLFSQLTTEAAVLTAMSNLIMLFGTVNGSQVVPLEATYRQYGFVTDLVPTAGNQSATFLTPSQVSNWGTCETINNRTPVNLITATSNTLKQVIPA